MNKGLVFVLTFFIVVLGIAASPNMFPLWYASHLPWCFVHFYVNVLKQKTAWNRAAGMCMVVIWEVWPLTWGALFGIGPRWVPVPFLLTFVILVSISGKTVPLNIATRGIFHTFWDIPLTANIFFSEYVLGVNFIHDGNGAYETVLDAHVMIAGMPTPQRVAALQKLGVVGVVNMCAEYPGPKVAYAAAGMEQLRLPTIDGSAPTHASLQQGVDFIQRKVRENPSGRVLVHCKGGMGRSAALCLCYLVTAHGKTVSETFADMKKRRSVVEPRIMAYDGVVRICKA